MMETYSAMRRNEVLTHTGTWMDIEDIMLSDILNSEVKVTQLCLTPCNPMD